MSLLAQVGADVAPFASQGILGAVFAWICLRVEKRLDRMEHTMKGLSTALLMDLASRKVLTPIAQKIVEEMLLKMGVNTEEP